MRQVSTADPHAYLVEDGAMIRAGGEVCPTLDGREYRLVAANDAISADRRQALEELAAHRRGLRERGVRVTPAEIKEWVNDDRP